MSTPAWHEAISQTFDVGWVREQFPSLQLTVNGQPAAFLDGPAGTQVPRKVMDAVQKYFLESNANTYGAFLTSRRTNEMIANARAAMADLLNCAPEEVVFGQNMTTITLGLARAIGRELKSGDEILVTVLDHDANYSPWKALEEKGVVIRHARFGGPQKQAQFKNQAGRRGLRVQHRWHDQSNSGHHEASTRSWRDDLRGCGPLRAAWPHRCESPRLRFSGVLALQVFRPTHGHTLRKERTSGAIQAI